MSAHGGGARIALENGGLLLFADAFATDAARLFAALERETAWERHRVKLFGRSIAAPRLSAWHGEPDRIYRYSGTSHFPQPFTPLLQEIRARVEATSGQRFDSVLLNFYRDGQDAMGWHSDDEPELGPAPWIASLSLGSTRRFVLRARLDHAQRFELDLLDGSLLVMEPPLQAHWQHALPRTRRACGPRINLTWRLLGPRPPG